MLYVQQSRFDEARTWYRHCLSIAPSSADIHHALGAVSLQQGHFLQAQREWKEAVRKYPSLASHEGMRLQLEKQRCYRYFDPLNRVRHLEFVPKYASHFGDLCFVSDEPVVSADECNQLISWANMCDWTNGRHYAVPTHDVPVHSVPQLCDWFVSWMEQKVYALLGDMFGLDARCFFVHDAFVVRYDASRNNSFLPAHLDESTHSMVLALNDDFDGGGTVFVDHNETILPRAPGSVVCFRGDKLRHGGDILTRGTRYILAVFLYYDDDNTTDQSRKRAALGSAIQESKRRNGFSFKFDVS